MKERIEKLIAKYNNEIETLNREGEAVYGYMKDSIDNNNQSNVELFFNVEREIIEKRNGINRFISDLESLLNYL
jgi:hypothetical protein